MLIDDLDEGRWTVEKSEYLMQRPWCTVRRDQVRLPNGAVNPEFYVMEYPSWINVIALTDEGRFVMIRQYRHGIQQTRYELVAGVVEDGEDPMVAAKRELAEETGYTGGDWQLLAKISGNPSVTNNWTYCYLAQGVQLTDEQHLDATEDIKVHLLTRTEVLKLLNEGKIVQALMLAPLWQYFYLESLSK